MHVLSLAFLLYFCVRNVFAAYTLQSNYNSTNFFDEFDFYTGKDPTHGTVQYTSKDVALKYNMIATKTSSIPGQEGQINTYFGAHSGAFNKSLEESKLRPSVRLSSKQKYTRGLFVADIAHLPVGECGLWPAFWSANLNGSWPAGGEIDIIEGVNLQTHNQMSLHTGTGGKCSVSSDHSKFTGTVVASNCAFADNPSGCFVTDTQTMSYGHDFNAVRGGVYVLQWTSDAIKIFWWARKDIPQDIIDGKPDPSKWAKPVASYGSPDCDVDAVFKDHQIIFNISFCGNWAGQAEVWGQQCQAKHPGTCADWVMNSTMSYREAYWEIASVKVYQNV